MVTYHRHDDINILAVDPSKEGQHLIQDHHFIQAVQQLVYTGQSI